MGLGKEDHRNTVLVAWWFMTLGSGLAYLAELVMVRFLCCALMVYFHHPYHTFWKEGPVLSASPRRVEELHALFGIFLHGRRLSFLSLLI